jgi:hypothetical protein
VSPGRSHRPRARALEIQRPRASAPQKHFVAAPVQATAGGNVRYQMRLGYRPRRLRSRAVKKGKHRVSLTPQHFLTAHVQATAGGNGRSQMRSCDRPRRLRSRTVKKTSHRVSLRLQHFLAAHVQTRAGGDDRWRMRTRDRLRAAKKRTHRASSQWHHCAVAQVRSRLGQSETSPVEQPRFVVAPAQVRTRGSRRQRNPLSIHHRRSLAQPSRGWRVANGRRPVKRWC